MTFAALAIVHLPVGLRVQVQIRLIEVVKAHAQILQQQQVNASAESDPGAATHGSIEKWGASNNNSFIGVVSIEF